MYKKLTVHDNHPAKIGPNLPHLILHPGPAQMAL